MSTRHVIWRVVGLGGGALLLVAAASSPRAPWLLWNGSGSVPYGIYLRLDRPAVKGDLVAACLSENLALFARERGYLLSGAVCPGGTAPVLKRLAATGGERLELMAGAISIDGTSWPRGEVRSEDSAGRPIRRLVTYPYEVSFGQVLLLGDHPRSFDGRYYGAMPESRILAAYRPLWTWWKEAS